MFAYKSFEKRRKIVAAKGYLRPNGEIVEFGVVDSFRQPSLTTGPVTTAIDCQSEPAVKVVSDAGANAAHIPFQAAGYRGHSSWKQAVQIAARIESGVSAVKFPFGSRPILRCRQRAKGAQNSN